MIVQQSPTPGLGFLVCGFQCSCLGFSGSYFNVYGFRFLIFIHVLGFGFQVSGSGFQGVARQNLTVFSDTRPTVTDAHLTVTADS